ncbi:hypothetical protein ACHAXA_010729 [Cyclostephanos tholiformis]|uniref:ShKT domain-containing protein n=1 Tax=Cyclostephanos tholiformis TaxID=382380 RepID=A0ABD3RGL1_9STRA
MMMMMTNIGIIVSLASLLLARHTASSSSSSSSSFNGEPKCIAVDSYSTYICTDDPVASRRAAMADPSLVDGEGADGDDDDGIVVSVHDVDLGVEQRIAGSEMEQLRIRNVLRRMRAYVEDEVLSRSEYEHVRDKCKNGHELCAFWTSVGECESNRGFMLDICPAACRLCLLSNINMMG